MSAPGSSSSTTTASLRAVRQRRFTVLIVVTVGALVVIMLLLSLATRHAHRMQNLESGALRCLADCHRMQHASRSLLSARQDFAYLAGRWQGSVQGFRTSFARLVELCDAEGLELPARLRTDWQEIERSFAPAQQAITAIGSDAIVADLGDHGLEQTALHLLSVAGSGEQLHHLRRLQRHLAAFDIAAIDFVDELDRLTAGIDRSSERVFSLSLTAAGLLILVTVIGSAWLILRIADLNIGLNMETRARRSSEESLQRREAALRSILASIDEGVVTLLPDGRISWINDAACALTGLEREMVMGRDIDEVLHLRDELSRLRIDTADEALRHHGVTLQRDDGATRLLEVALSPIRGDAGHQMGRVLVLIDIGERRELEQRLHHAETMETIGQLAGGVAHDFNNMLTGILGGAELLSLEKQLSDRSRKQIDTIITAAQRAAGLTRQLLDYSRRSTMQREHVDLHQLIEDSIRLLARSFDRRIDIVRELEASGHWCLGDAGQLQNAIINLAVNARDAMAGVGRLCISSRDRSFDAGAAGERALAPGRYCELEFSDNGSGIDPAVLPHIFEPFYTTKDVGHGSGLGLSAVQGTVERHGGAISIDSAPDCGCTVTILLPSCAPAAQPPRDSGPTPTWSGRRVLVVDDEESVRQIACSRLEAIGFEVGSATDGLQAMDVLGRDPHAWDLVILDMVMPRLNGRDTMAALRSLRSDLPVLLWSGYSAGQDIDQLVGDPRCSFIAKPVRHEQLAAAITDLLTSTEERP